MRVVLDANVLVAAYAARGLCESVLEICLENHEIVLGEEILAEVEKALELKLKMSTAAVREVIAQIRTTARIVAPAPIEAGACRDAFDLHVLGVALTAHADAIVTGDKDLLALQKHGDIPILSPRGFWERLQQA